MLRRMLAATLLRVDNFEDVEHDRGATVQGVQVAAMVIAVRQCLAYDSTLRAIGVVIISVIPVLILNAVIFVVWTFGMMAP